MTTYYRLFDSALLELTPEHFAGLAQSKRDGMRLFVIDAQPAPTANQVVIDAGIVVGPVEAHQTWALRSKTAEESEAEAIQAEKAQITTYIADIQTQLDISNATRAAMTTNQRFNALESDTRATMKAVKFLLRQAKRSI